jgi:hypothetical protein
VLTAEFHLVEFLDGLPLSGVDVTLVVKVAPIFEVRVIIEPQPGDPPRPPGPPESEIVEEPDLNLAINVTSVGVTGSDGNVSFSLNLQDAFAQASRMRKGGKQAKGATAFLDARVDFLGLLFVQRRAIAQTGPDGDVKRNIIVDLAKSIVGHTTETSALLWFQIHGTPTAAHVFTCELTPQAGAPRIFSVTPDASRAQTAVLTTSGLAPGTRHTYNLRIRRATESGSDRVIARGTFLTAPAAGSSDNQRLTMAFGSCHLPTSSGSSLSRWRVLANRDDYDLLFLIGDQIYGDGIEKIFPNDDWLTRYLKRYNQLWAYQPIRDVLRSTPVYMTLDDHEITDDWGVVSIPADRLNAGLQAYRIFQQAHNPGGFGAQFLDYHFRRGPIAFYFMDSRTARGTDSQFPIIGRQQFERIRQWAFSEEARSADVIVFVAPVPLAVLPIQELQILVDRLAQVGGAAAGALVGAAIGAIFGPGALIGAAIGAMVGALGAELAYEHLEDTITEPDIRDAWTFDTNLVDCVRVLDTLFDLANDIDAAGRPYAPARSDHSQRRLSFRGNSPHYLGQDDRGTRSSKQQFAVPGHRLSDVPRACEQRHHGGDSPARGGCSFQHRCRHLQRRVSPPAGSAQLRPCGRGKGRYRAAIPHAVCRGRGIRRAGADDGVRSGYAAGYGAQHDRRGAGSAWKTHHAASE